MEEDVGLDGTTDGSGHRRGWTELRFESRAACIPRLHSLLPGVDKEGGGLAQGHPAAGSGERLRETQPQVQ